MNHNNSFYVRVNKRLKQTLHTNFKNRQKFLPRWSGKPHLWNTCLKNRNMEKIVFYGRWFDLYYYFCSWNSTHFTQSRVDIDWQDCALKKKTKKCFDIISIKVNCIFVKQNAWLYYSLDCILPYHVLHHVYKLSILL